jgi:hypothetical protein
MAFVSCASNFIRPWDMDTSYPIAIALVIFSLLLVFRFGLSSGYSDSREPPEVKPSVPFVGHLFGMLWHQGEYLSILRQASIDLMQVSRAC